MSVSGWRFHPEQRTLQEAACSSLGPTERAHTGPSHFEQWLLVLSPWEAYNHPRHPTDLQKGRRRLEVIEAPHRRVPTATPVPPLRNQKLLAWTVMVPSAFTRPPACKQPHVNRKTGSKPKQNENSWTQVTVPNTPPWETHGGTWLVKQIPKPARNPGGKSPYCGFALKSDLAVVSSCLRKGRDGKGKLHSYS